VFGHLQSDQLQALVEVIRELGTTAVGTVHKSHVRIELGGKGNPTSEMVESVTEILKETLGCGIKVTCHRCFDMSTALGLICRDGAIE